MKKMLKIIGSVILVIGIAAGLLFWRAVNKFQEATNTKEEWKNSYGEIIKNLSYGDQKNQLYDLYIPAELDKSKPQGVLLCIHGGAWSGGSRGEMDFACKRYAKAGYMTATMEYSLLSEKHPDITIDTMIHEIDMCIDALRDELSERGITADKLALFGGSAGGHLSLLYAYAHAFEQVFCRAGRVRT